MNRKQLMQQQEKFWEFEVKKRQDALRLAEARHEYYKIQATASRPVDDRPRTTREQRRALVEIVLSKGVEHGQRIADQLGFAPRYAQNLLQSSGVVREAAE